jgi:CheY-like chemotaxis protein
MPRPRILVVEADELVRDFVATVLRLKEYTIDTAVNGREGLGLLDQHRYDLVVSDMRMPELDGPGLYHEVMQRSAGAAPPFLFITGDHEKPDYIWFFQRARVPSLAKPFSETALSQAVERILGGWPRNS